MVIGKFSDLSLMCYTKNLAFCRNFLQAMPDSFSYSATYPDINLVENHCPNHRIFLIDGAKREH
jgi:hypothetical protein